MRSVDTAAALALPPAAGRTGLRRISVVAALEEFRWRLLAALALATAASTELFAQPSIYEYWTLGAIAAGFADVWVQAAGYCVAILLALTMTERAMPRITPIFRPVAIVAALAVGALAGGLLDVAINDLGFAYVGSLRFAGEVLRWMVTAGAVLAIYVEQRGAARAAERLHVAAVDRLSLDRRLLEARLQVMRAQIEPHFLFNTLATVKRLCQSDVDRGLATLDNLVRYLRAALPQIRRGSTTLGQEADLVRAYLAVLQIRMGSYLAFSVDVPEALRERAFPPMMLLTLAENAIKHGLAPSPDAGRIDVVARHEHDALLVSVADTGVGFGVAKTAGTGIGLANTRARLSALYGPDAELTLSPNAPRGVVATLRLPWRDAGVGDARPDAETEAS